MTFMSMRFNQIVSYIVVLMLALSSQAPSPTQAAGDEEHPLLSGDEVPTELSLVISASVLSMRGEDDPEAIWPVSISPEAAAGLKDPNFAFDGFTLLGTGLRSWDMVSDDPPLYTLSAVLVFADKVGRRATMSLVADYSISDQNLEIERAAALTMAPPSPETRIYVVMAKDIPDSLLEGSTDQLELFRTVADRAVHGAGGAIASSPQDYYVFAFVIDRVSPDSQFQLMVSDQAAGLSGASGNAVTTDFSGWRVGVLRGEFALGAGPELFFKTVYTPGAREADGGGKARLAGVFSSHGLSKRGGQ